MRVPKLTPERSDELAHADCRSCGRKAAEEMGGRNGVCYDPATREFYTECTGCWNASVRQREAADRAARAAAPKCEGCGRGQRSYTVCAGTPAAAQLCRGCKDRAQRNTAQPMLFGSGFGHLTKDAVLAAARKR